MSIASGIAQSGVLYLLVQSALGLAAGKNEAAVATGLLAGWQITIPMSIAAAGTLAIFMLMTDLTAARISARMSSGAQTAARNALLGSFLTASWKVQSRERQGHLQELLSTHVDRVANGVALVANGTVALFNFLVLMSVALLVEPLGTLVIVVGAGMLFVLLRPFAARTHSSAEAQTKANADYAVQVSEIVRLAQEIRVFDATDRIFERARLVARCAEASLVRTRYLLRSLPSVYQASALALVVAALGGMYAFGAGEIAALGAVVLLLVRSLSYSQQLQAVYQQSAEVRSYLDDFNRWHQSYAGSSAGRGSETLQRVDSLEFARVSFAYTEGEPVLSDVSFVVHGGESIGIIGPSGVGKSTLVQLLLRLREPVEGAYCINGLEAGTYQIGDFYRAIAFVPQEPQLIRGSVADNIRFFRPGISDDEVAHAAALANLASEIEAAPGAYNRQIGEGAAGLSGGQKQRLAVARALVGSPSMLILDEPTSALDAESDRLLRQSLASLRGSLTMFIVAHRMATLEFCDRIMVVERGALSAFAPAEELVVGSQYFRGAAGSVAPLT